MKEKTMKNRKLVFLAAVLCIVLAVITASILIPHFAARAIAIGSLLIFGSTVTYQYPVSGTIAPTATQSGPRGAQMVTAAINVVDTDVTAVITHNWGLSTTELAALLPLIYVFYGGYTTNTGTVLSNPSFTSGANSVTFNKISATSSGGTIIVQLLRPSTIIR
jgi:hypothetical protein